MTKKKIKKSNSWFCPICSRLVFFETRLKKGIENHLLDDLGEAIDCKWQAEEVIEEVEKTAEKEKIKLTH